MITCLTITSASAAAGKPVQPENSLGWSLFRAQSRHWVNTVISPSSIYIALSLAFEGSQGYTRADARKFLHLPLIESGALHPSILDEMKEMSRIQGLDVSSANAIWTDSHSPQISPPAKGFETVAQSLYGAGIKRMSFNPPEHVVHKINAWIERKTNGLIRNLISPSDIHHIHVALVNAVYFKGLWSTPFKKKYSQEDRFQSPDGQSSAVFMNQTDDFRYFSNSDAQVLELPYVGDRVVMSIVLPSRGESLQDLEKKLGPETLNTWFAQLQSRLVRVRIPRFRMEWGLENLCDDLVRLGMPKEGDFSPLGIKHFELQSVFHKAVVQVNEEGTEAAAVTAIMGVGGAMPPRPEEFIANRPFLFFIRDIRSGAWLFIGRVLKP